METITFDKRNYRKHSDRNKRVIKKSLEELGAGRSVLIDKNNTLIAGNGVFEQAQALGIPVRVIETDGTELVAVKRTDISEGDEKRKRLALADNVASDLSEFDDDLLHEDFSMEELSDWGLESEEEMQPAVNDELPPELQGLDINPDDLPKIEGDDQTAMERIIIVYPKDRAAEVAQLIGLEIIKKVVYSLDELNHNECE